MAAEVVVRVQDEDTSITRSPPPGNGTSTPPYPVEEIPTEVIVRAEEILLVVLVLVLWVAAIALFFNRWGKIRMLEPYQPKFQQQHRASCPMGDSVISPQVSVKSERLVQRMKHQRMSFSKYNVNCMGDSSMYMSLPSPNPLRRPRQNSVFVGSSTMAVINPPRRVKSAIDIQHMVLSDYSYSPGSLSGCSSLLPMFAKRPSITVERSPNLKQRSVMLDYHNQPRTYHRRPSCLIDRPSFGKHRHFISFDQPGTNWDRRTSITIERTSSGRKQAPVLSFDRAGSSLEQPSLVVNPPSTSQEHPPCTIAGAMGSMGRSNSPAGRSCPESMVSLHLQPGSYPRRPSFHLDMPPVSPTHRRLSNSLDHGTVVASTSSHGLRSPSSSSFDETQIKLSNLENCKVSDV